MSLVRIVTPVTLVFMPVDGQVPQTFLRGLGFLISGLVLVLLLPYFQAWFGLCSPARQLNIVW